MNVPSKRIYLDNAATSWPKPTSVYEAVDDYQRRIGAAAGRGAYGSAAQANQVIHRTRARLRQLLNAPVDSDLCFTFSGTDSLNLCLMGSLKSGDKVVTSIVEHNSVLRPLAYLRATRNVDVQYLPCDSAGVIDLQAAKTLIDAKTQLVVTSHASNVTGAVQPIEELGAMAKTVNAKILVDAAQTVGHLRIDLSRLPVDMLAASGHKGLLGPLGTGFVYFAPGVAEQVTPIRFGGTGTNSESDIQPTEGPERFESGNMNVASLAGLLAGIEYVSSAPGHDLAAADSIVEALNAIDNVRTVGPTRPDARVGLVSFSLVNLDCHDVAAMLDSAFGIQVRSGLHCAPRIHQHLDLPGTVRASWGPFTTEDELATFLEAIRQVAGSH